MMFVSVFPLSWTVAEIAKLFPISLRKARYALGLVGREKERARRLRAGARSHVLSLEQYAALVEWDDCLPSSVWPLRQGQVRGEADVVCPR